MKITNSEQVELCCNLAEQALNSDYWEVETVLDVDGNESYSEDTQDRFNYYYGAIWEQLENAKANWFYLWGSANCGRWNWWLHTFWGIDLHSVADLNPASAKFKGAFSPFFCAYLLTLYVDPTSAPKRSEITLNVRFMGYDVALGRIA